MEPSWKGLVSLDETREVAHSICTLWGYNMLKCAVQKRVLTRTWPSWHPGIRFPASRTVRKKILLFISYPVYGTYLEQNTAGISRWFSDKESACQCMRYRLDLCVRTIPWRRKWQPTPVFLPGESYGQRSLVGYSPWGHKELDTTERLHFTHLSNLKQIFFLKCCLPFDFVIKFDLGKSIF